MQTYTVGRYTFTTGELSGPNPYIASDGTVNDGFEFQSLAFNKAKEQYLQDQLPESERAARIEQRERFERKMSS